MTTQQSPKRVRLFIGMARHEEEQVQRALARAQAHRREALYAYARELVPGAQKVTASVGPFPPSPGIGRSATFEAITGSGLSLVAASLSLTERLVLDGILTQLLRSGAVAPDSSNRIVIFLPETPESEDPAQ